MKCSTSIYTVVFTLIWASVLVSCSKKVQPTEVLVEDSIRHYYPLINGQQLNLNFRLANVGEYPLVISDIHPSCGCIEVDNGNNNIILPGGTTTLKFAYQSEKNIGYVRHVIRVYGNVKPKGVIHLIFDVNVVPHADYTRDYEQLYKEISDEKRLAGELVDGTEAEKGYYLDDERINSRSHPKYPWLEE